MEEIEIGEYVRTEKGSILENTLEGHKSIIENIEKDEDYIREFGEIVKHSKNIIDLLKVGHHSYRGSSSVYWLKTLKPNTSIVTNRHKGADKRTLFKIKLFAHSDIFITGTENGIIAAVGDNGQIEYFNNIHR